MCLGGQSERIFPSNKQQVKHLSSSLDLTEVLPKCRFSNHYLYLKMLVLVLFFVPPPLSSGGGKENLFPTTTDHSTGSLEVRLSCPWYCLVNFPKDLLPVYPGSCILRSFLKNAPAPAPSLLFRQILPARRQRKTDKTTQKNNNNTFELDVEALPL